MLKQTDLISAEALRRYDDNGEPMYSTAERIVLALRWFGWVSMFGLADALGMEDMNALERKRFQTALWRLVKRGVVQIRGEFAGMRGNHGQEQEYRLNTASPALPLRDTPAMKARAA